MPRLGAFRATRMAHCRLYARLGLASYMHIYEYNGGVMQQLENYFRGLSETTRLRIMNLLLQGELCVCDIQRILDASQPSISRHLNYLKHSGLVLDHRDGLRVFYRLVDENRRELKALYRFLRKAFAGKSVLEDDLKQLREAKGKVACSVPAPNRTGRAVMSGLTSN